MMTAKPTTFLSLSIKPWGLLTAAGVVACISTVFGFIGRFSWFLDLFSHFRVQYAIGLSILGFLLLWGRRRRTAFLFLVFASVNLALILPLYFGRSRSLAHDAPTLRAMLINVNTRRGDPERVRQAIVSANPDILVLEEISARWMPIASWLMSAYPFSLTEPREDNFGMGLFSKFPLEGEVVYIGDAEVPSIVATLTTPHSPLLVIATHPLPPGGREYSRLRNEQLERLPDYVQSRYPVLLLGDLNVTPWNYYFRRLLANTGLRDSAKGFGVQPSWPNYNPLLRIPIDHCLHSKEVIIVDRHIGEDVRSDHYPLIVDFVIRKE